MNLKGKFYRTAKRPTLLRGSECQGRHQKTGTEDSGSRNMHAPAYERGSLLEVGITFGMSTSGQVTGWQILRTSSENIGEETLVRVILGLRIEDRRGRVDLR